IGSAKGQAPVRARCVQVRFGEIRFRRRSLAFSSPRAAFLDYDGRKSLIVIVSPEPRPPRGNRVARNLSVRSDLIEIAGRGTERCPVKEITNPLPWKGYNRANFADNNLSCSLPFVGFPKRPRHEYADLSQFQLLANPGTTLPTGCLYHQRRCRSRRSRNCH